VSSRYHNRLNRIKEIEDRQKEISELQRQIGYYGKSRETYRAYIRSGRDQDFFEVNRSDLTLHIAAKKYFNERGYGKDKKLPSMNMLKQEWATLESERKTLYRDYHQLKEHHRQLTIAKDNCDRLLGLKHEEPARVAQKQLHYSHKR
jgi:hypothetical protein